MLFRYSPCRAFKLVMTEVNDLAGQHEVIAENLQSDIIREVTILIKDFKDERKKVSFTFYVWIGRKCVREWNDDDYDRSGDIGNEPSNNSGIVYKQCLYIIFIERSHELYTKYMYICSFTNFHMFIL